MKFPFQSKNCLLNSNATIISEIEIYQGIPFCSVRLKKVSLYHQSQQVGWQIADPIASVWYGALKCITPIWDICCSFLRLLFKRELLQEKPLGKISIKVKITLRSSLVLLGLWHMCGNGMSALDCCMFSFDF